MLDSGCLHVVSSVFHVDMQYIIQLFYDTLLGRQMMVTIWNIKSGICHISSRFDMQ